MAIFNLIEFHDDSGEIIVARVPQDQASGEFVLGSQLVVHETQVAAFFRNGQLLDLFGPGRHTLNTQNLPLLGALIGAPFGGKSPFRASVCYVATNAFVNLGWGTQSPVVFRDSDFRMITLRAHGTFSIRVSDPRLFLTSLVGTRGLETTFALEEFLRSIIVSKLNEVMGSVMRSILDLPVHYSAISQGTKKAVLDDFSQYGLELVDLFVQAITPPAQVQDMINRASGVAVQDVAAYQAIAAADAMRDAARNPGGAAGEGVGAGIGIAMGLGMAQQMLGGGSLSPTGAQAGAAAVQNRLSAGEIKQRLAQLKELLDEGLIDEADFAEKKKALIAMI